MNRKITLLVLTLVCALVLTGCSCSHEWKDADCVTPKTCTQCQETEGEALGHTWLDATCTAPKTCSVCAATEGEVTDHVWTDASCAAPKTCAGCGLTEGDALEHTWVEANYQAPQTCSVCAATEGEPLPAFFDEMGLAFNVEEVGVAYPLTIGGQSFTYTIDSYEVYTSDDSHPGKDGFEWRTVSYTVECLQGSLPYYLPTYSDYNNYYDVEGFNASVAQVDTDQLFAMTFAVNHYGMDYTDCLFQVERSHVNNTDTGWTMNEILSFQVPVGFDGMFICMGDGANITSDYFQQYMNLYTDADTLFFRLK